MHACLQSSWNSLPKCFHAGGGQSQRQIDWHGAAPTGSWMNEALLFLDKTEICFHLIICLPKDILLSFGHSVLSFCYFWSQSQPGSFTHSDCCMANGRMHPADQRLGRCRCRPVWWDLDTKDLTCVSQTEITPKAIWVMFKGGQGNYWSVCVPIYSTCDDSCDDFQLVPVVSCGLGETL